MRYREVVAKLRTLGCTELARAGGGSHRKWHNPANARSTVIPDWGSRDLKSGTLRGIMKQMGIDWDRFSNA